MENTKAVTHTEGPWSWSYLPQGTEDSFGPSWDICSGNLNLATVYREVGAGNRPDCGEANARLIAASPDLYDAIKKFVSWCDVAGTSENGSVAVPMNGKIIRRFRAALAKVEG